MPPAGQGAQGGGERTHQVIPGEQVGAPVICNQLRQGGLLDGQERANLVAAGADHPDGRRQQEQVEIAGENEDQCRQDH